jgi:acyl-coenzyme A synthetase/AMP-(fatty) acid ligase
VPKRVRFVDALPMSAMSKVLKEDLRVLDEEEVPA